MLKKYQGFVFYDPDTTKIFHVYKGNMEYHRGRGNGWFVLSMCANDDGDKEKMEAFLLEVACELIGRTQQKQGVRVVNLAPTEEYDEEDKDK